MGGGLARAAPASSSPFPACRIAAWNPVSVPHSTCPRPARQTHRLATWPLPRVAFRVHASCPVLPSVCARGPHCLSRVSLPSALKAPVVVLASAGLFVCPAVQGARPAGEPVTQHGSRSAAHSPVRTGSADGQEPGKGGRALLRYRTPFARANASRHLAVPRGRRSAVRGPRARGSGAPPRLGPRVNGSRGVVGAVDRSTPG